MSLQRNEKPVIHAADPLAQGKSAEIIKQLEKEADLVIVDTPPAGILSDAAMLDFLRGRRCFVVKTGVLLM